MNKAKHSKQEEPVSQFTYHELKAALKVRPGLQLSEEHLTQTIRASHIAYKSRRQRERIKFPAFLLRQIRFAGATVWLLQGLLLLCAFWLFGLADIGTVLNFTPNHLPVLLGCFAVFIAMTGIPFIGRSVQYKMLEAELATRISTPKLLLARLLIIGIGDGLLLTVSFLMVSTKAEFGTGRIALYLLLPYLIACCGCLFIQASAKCGQQGFVCTAFCFSLTALLYVLYKTAPVVYAQASAPVWGMICALCAAILILGVHRLLSKAASLDLSPNGI